MKIPILLINITMRFPTARKTVFTTVTHLNKVSKGTTPEQVFRFLRVPDKDKCCDYEITCLKVVGNTKVVGS